MMLAASLMWAAAEKLEQSKMTLENQQNDSKSDKTYILNSGKKKEKTSTKCKGGESY